MHHQPTPNPSDTVRISIFDIWCNKSTSNTNKLQDTAASPVATVHTAVFLFQVDSCVLPSAKPEKKNPYFIALEVVLLIKDIFLT